MSDKSRFASPLKDRAREMRQFQTLAEKHAWYILRDRRSLGLKFRRQVPIDDYIVDFYCEELRLVLGVDGDVHGTPEKMKRDAAKDKRLVELGYRVMRITNDRSINDPDALIEMIRSLRPSPGVSHMPLPEGKA